MRWWASRCSSTTTAPRPSASAPAARARISRDARAASERLGIAHYVLDYESRFRESVIDDFADAYLRGETPIPCVRCNQTVKFRDLMEVAADLGAEALATGHYVRRTVGADGPELRRGLDPSRDQSWFLFATTRAQLGRLRFPLGALPKAEVRAMAVAFGLSVADKPDSQDICFVPDGDYATLIDKLRPDAAGPGEIVHEDGRVLGRHEGVIRYTVGQRRGLRVATGEPLFVTALDAPNRRVLVGPRASLMTASLGLKEETWLGAEPTLAEAAANDIPVLARVPLLRPVGACAPDARRRRGARGVRPAGRGRLPGPGLRALRRRRPRPRARRRLHRGDDARLSPQAGPTRKAQSLLPSRSRK